VRNRSFYLKLAALLAPTSLPSLASSNQLIRLPCQDFFSTHNVALSSSLRHYPLGASRSLYLPMIQAGILHAGFSMELLTCLGTIRLHHAGDVGPREMWRCRCG
jgi:hypothetical protein